MKFDLWLNSLDTKLVIYPSLIDTYSATKIRRSISQTSIIFVAKYRIIH